MFWKITNISKAPVKVSFQKSNLVTVGVIIQPEEFCISMPQLTTTMDAQERRKFIKIDRKYTNDYKLELGVSHSEKTLTEAIKNAEQYTSLKGE